MTDCCLCCTDELLASFVDMRVMAYLVMRSSFDKENGRIINILNINKTDLGRSIKITDNRSIKKKLVDSFYSPDYIWYKQIPGRLDIVQVPDYYNDGDVKEKYNFNIVIDEEILKELMVFDERYLRVFMYLHKHARCYQQTGGFNKSIGRINNELGYSDSGQSVANLKDAIYELKKKKYIDFEENPKGLIAKNGHYVPTICKVKVYTFKNKKVETEDKEKDIQKREQFKIVEEENKKVKQEVVENAKEEDIKIEEWQRVLVEKTLGRNASNEEYKKMFAVNGTLVTKERWERNQGATGQCTQEEYENTISDRIKKVLGIK